MMEQHTVIVEKPRIFLYLRGGGIALCKVFGFEVYAKVGGRSMWFGCIRTGNWG